MFVEWIRSYVHFFLVLKKKDVFASRASDRHQRTSRTMSYETPCFELRISNVEQPFVGRKNPSLALVDERVVAMHLGIETLSRGSEFNVS